jgi:hypothetical protein
VSEDRFKLWLSMAARDQPIRSRLVPELRRAGYWTRTAHGDRFNGSQIGRGAGVGRVLVKAMRADRLRSRPVLARTRVVRLQASSHAVRDHLRYLARSKHDVERRPILYGPDSDVPDVGRFVRACQEDRHQFRTILGAVDSCEYDDLRPLVRRLMRQVSSDLRTNLDWVAADHYDTANPHSHIVIRGVDERGYDLVIAREYIHHGFRARAGELVALDLGPELDAELGVTKNRDLEVQQEYATRVDRELVASRDAQGRVWFDHADRWEQATRAGRLRVLETLGLAHSDAEGAWYLQPDLVERLDEIAWRNRMGFDRRRGRQVQNDPLLPHNEMPGPAGQGGDYFGPSRTHLDTDSVLYRRHLDGRVTPEQDLYGNVGS